MDTLRKLITIWDDVHHRLDEGEPWEAVRPENFEGKPYAFWQGYMTGKIINEARDLVGIAK